MVTNKKPSWVLYHQLHSSVIYSNVNPESDYLTKTITPTQVVYVYRSGKSRVLPNKTGRYFDVD